MARRRGRIGDGLAVLSGARPDDSRRRPVPGRVRGAGRCAALDRRPRGALRGLPLHMALGVWWPFALLSASAGASSSSTSTGCCCRDGARLLAPAGLLMAVPRVGLALVLGIVISTPLTLQIFHKEIDTRSSRCRPRPPTFTSRAWTPTRASQASPSCGRRSPASRPSSPAGGVPTPTSRRCTPRWPPRARTTGPWPPSGSSPPGRSASRRHLRHRRRRHGGGLRPGAGAADAQRDVVAAADADLEAALAAVSPAPPAAGRGGRRPGDRPGRAGPADRAADGAAGRVRRDQRRHTGILIRLQALSALSEADVTMAVAHYMLALLFISIELLPVLMKMLLNLGPRSTYDGHRPARRRRPGDRAAAAVGPAGGRAGRAGAAGHGGEGARRPAEGAVLARRRARLRPRWPSGRPPTARCRRRGPRPAPRTRA